MRAAYLGVVATVVLSHAVLAEDKSSYALPKPTGQFFVGRTVEWWTDHARREQATLEGNERELQAIIYYPANGAGKHAAYYPGPDRLGRDVGNQATRATFRICLGSGRGRASSE